MNPLPCPASCTSISPESTTVFIALQSNNMVVIEADTYMGNDISRLNQVRLDSAQCGVVELTCDLA